MAKRFHFGLLVLTLAGCEPGPVPADAPDRDAPVDTNGLDVPSFDARPSDGGGTDAGGSELDIGRWTDAAGTCPDGAPRVELDTSAEIEAAARGEAPFDGDAPGTCYLIRNGTYTSSTNVMLYVTVGGAVGAPRRFVGESRSGVRIVQRAALEGVAHVEIRNLTFDLTGYGHAGAFNTLTVLDSEDVMISHVDFTGDCATGSRGGHVEVEGSDAVVIDSCLIERFGACSGDGHLDHGVYLASGTNIAVRNSEIRENSARGIQLNTEGGAFGTLSDVLIERNRIHHNGHRPYEDGIVVNATGTGTVTNLTIRRNLVYENRYSGLRFSGAALSGVVVEYNTFADDGGEAGGGAPSEINLDDVGSGASTVVRRNVLSAAVAVLNSCYDAGPRGFSVEDNLIDLATDLACVTGSTIADPGFADPGAGDFHGSGTGGFGAYAP